MGTCGCFEKVHNRGDHDVSVTKSFKAHIISLMFIVYRLISASLTLLVINSKSLITIYQFTLDNKMTA